MVFGNRNNYGSLRIGSDRVPRPPRARRRWPHQLAAAIAGGALGQLYFLCLLKNIPFPYAIGVILSLAITLLLGLGNLMFAQLRCISLLTFPMYCGKPGRGVLKAVILTYVIAGPITNMGLNAKEVVRVFSCSTHLLQNLTRMQYLAVSKPFKEALFDMRAEVSQIKDTLRSIRDVVIPIELEIEGENSRKFMTRNKCGKINRPNHRETQLREKHRKDIDIYQDKYKIKLETRCENLVARATAFYLDVVKSPDFYHIENHSSCGLFWQNKLGQNMCNLKQILGPDICDSRKELNPGLGEGYAQLKKSKNMLTNNKDVSLQYKINTVRELYDIQDAKETGDRVIRAFEEKYIIMHLVGVTVDVCVALLFLRIVTAAVRYHDRYLISIDYDNIYITSYFKRIDERRRMRNENTLLPLKKMERIKYVDVRSFCYKSSERDNLFTHILRLMLEVVTATTFVMLDRLFYEALDVVRQHTQAELSIKGTRDLEIQVDGTGTLAGMVRKLLGRLNNVERSTRREVNETCLPRPHLMPPLYYFMIYGGYLWILLLLILNPYTMRFKRWICSYFYPRREKQRILHLYNDILKKRMKMQKTLRKKAIQAVRAHYLSGENLLSLRMKFPRLLGWLQVLPAARMTCLICGETGPRTRERPVLKESWHSCAMSKCPFVYCVECWREVGARCLACDPTLHDLSDVDSLTEDELLG